MTCKLLEWFESHWSTTTQNSLFYRDLDRRRRDVIACTAPFSSDNEFLVCSFYDDQNFIAIGNKLVAWNSDVSGGTIPFEEIEIFHRKGDIPDDRYAEKEIRFYFKGKIIDEAEALKHVGEEILFLRTGSPLVYLKDRSNNYFDFKVEPGHHIDTFYLGITKGANFANG